MNKKRYHVTTGDMDDIHITVEVDHDALTEELATQINRFFCDHDARLAAADDNVVHAVIKMAARYFLLTALEGDSVHGCNRELGEAEGWPNPAPVRLIEIDGIPEFESMDFQLEEIKQ